MNPTPPSPPPNIVIVAPGPREGTVRLAPDGKVVTPPADWILVPPGDPALSRRVKLAGPCYVVQEKRGRKLFSRGIWTDRMSVERIRADLERERKDPSHAKKLAAAATKRAREQTVYVEDFHGAVLRFLDFPLQFRDLATRLADLVTAHATPVGSGTVARTKRIPIERRAEAAVIAWMRHATTGYDGMRIPRERGRRREVRRMLAERSKELLAEYRAGRGVGEGCPLVVAVEASRRRLDESAP